LALHRAPPVYAMLPRYEYFCGVAGEASTF
jgi:hypothetical protein